MRFKKNEIMDHYAYCAIARILYKKMTWLERRKFKKLKDFFSPMEGWKIHPEKMKILNECAKKYLSAIEYAIYKAAPEKVEFRIGWIG